MSKLNKSQIDDFISASTQTALDGKENAFTKNTAFNKNFGTSAGRVTEGDDPRLSDARTPLAHTHTKSEITDFSDADYATSTQGTTADNALPKSGGAMTGAITTNSTFDGRDVAVDGTKLDTIETNADVTDTANVTAAGALMDSEVDADIKTLSLPASTTISTFGASLVDDADASTARTTLGVDAAGTDNSTDVTLAGTGTYLSIAGQEITVDALTESDISDFGSYQPLDSILTNTTASYTIAEESKLAGIETGAEVNTVDSVNTQTGAVVLDADDISDTSTTNKFTSATDISRLSNTSGTNTGDQDISGIATNASAISTHEGLTNNPHSVTATQVGLGNVDNTTDLNKPISTLTQTALDGKAEVAGSDTQVQYNNSGSLGASANLTFDGTNLTAVNDIEVNGSTIGKGGGGISTNFVAGASSLSVNTTGFRNLAIGDTSLEINTEGNNNMGTGYGSLALNTTGSQNTGVGASTLASNTTADNNTAIGYLSLEDNTTGENNTAAGTFSLYTNTTGGDNAAFGQQALRSNLDGSNNCATGFQTLWSNTSANNNTGNGYRNLYSNTTGANNTSAGSSGLFANTTGNGNSSHGYLSLRFNTEGNNNAALGQRALYENTTGSNNVGVGNNAGRYISGGSTANAITTNSIFIGNNTKANANDEENQIVIGHNVTGAGSNTVTVGNPSIVLSILRGTINLPDMPTSSAGLNSGDVWSDSGTLKIV